VGGPHGLEVKQGIGEGEAGIDRVPRRAAVAAHKSQRGREEGTQTLEAGAGGGAFHPAQARGVGRDIRPFEGGKGVFEGAEGVCKGLARIRPFQVHAGEKPLPGLQACEGA
jgi:hypothetical protein